MDNTNKEEHKDVKDPLDDKNLSQTHDHARFEETLEQKPDPVDNMELETHDSVHDIKALVGSASTVTKSSENTTNPAKASCEAQTNGENGSVLIIVDTALSHEGEVPVMIEKEGDDGVKGEENDGGVSRQLGLSSFMEVKVQDTKTHLNGGHEIEHKSTGPERVFHWEGEASEGDEYLTGEEQVAFMKEVETFYREKYLEWKPPKFYREELNLLK